MKNKDLMIRFTQLSGELTDNVYLYISADDWTFSRTLNLEESRELLSELAKASAILEVKQSLRKDKASEQV